MLGSPVTPIARAVATEPTHEKTLELCWRQYAVPVEGQSDVVIFAAPEPGAPTLLAAALVLLAARRSRLPYRSKELSTLAA